jgi:hypothetical protein
VGPRIGLDVVAEKKILSMPRIEHQSPSPYPATLLTDHSQLMIEILRNVQ